MNPLSDEIHNCSACKLFPCTLQPEVSGDAICKACPMPSRCCQSPLLVLMPCEKSKLEHEHGVIKLKPDGWCFYYNNGCSIHDKRPIACRIASCRFIRENKVPEIIRGK